MKFKIFYLSTFAILLGCSSAPPRITKSTPGSANCADQSPCNSVPDPKDSGNQDSTQSDAITDKRIWRLTPEQFANTVDGLLKRTTKIEAKIDADTVPEDGFGNESSVLGISNIFASNLEDAISKVVAESSADLEKQLTCGKIAAATPECIQKFAEDFGSRAFRRPLTLDESKRYTTLYAAVQKSLGNAEGLSAVAEAILRSPNTLFRTELGEEGKDGDTLLTPYELASALSFALTNSPPDAQLLAKAADNSLATDAVYEAEAKRLLASDGFSQGLSQYLQRWSGVRWLRHVDKNKEMFKDFSEATKEAMLKESVDFVTMIVKQNKSSFKAFMTSSKTTITPPLAAIYGLQTFTGSKVYDSKPGERSGFITLPAVMATNSSSNQTGPVHRGVFLLKKLMCQSMPPPPPEASTVLPETDASLTLRERFKVHSSKASCAVCHVQLDPFGFAMEHYDPIGRYRTMDNGRPVDATGEIVGTTNSNQTFKSAVDMLENLSKSEDVHKCFVKNAFRYVFGRSDTKRDGELIDETMKDFSSSDLDMSTIFLNLVKSNSFKMRKGGK